ncbi:MULTISPECIES: hypothetical protein [Desulfococcus]|nr:hypothetical protein [Desulfococcus multivorans]AOY57566.1 uncharacterized protein Dmul_07910 [Desulfococcus multivorans]AQU99981.1 hypothetical protein B2D07_03795 [Desulfococcus multivorans]
MMTMRPDGRKRPLVEIFMFTGYGGVGSDIEVSRLEKVDLIGNAVSGSVLTDREASVFSRY